MLHLHHSISPLSEAHSSHLTSSYRFGISGVDNYKPWSFKKSRRKNGAMEKDSEFEVDPDKAREALRKLDEQFKSLSEKQANTPKVRAADFSQVNVRETQQSVNLLSGSFLTYLGSFLLVFTLVYNVVFIMFIKPSIDGNYPEESVSATKINGSTQGGESVQQLMTTPEMPLGL